MTPDAPPRPSAMAVFEELASPSNSQPRAPREILERAGCPCPELVWVEFLSSIHADDTAGLIDLRFIREGQVRRVECTKIAEAIAEIGNHLDWNCYVGIAKRRLPAAEFDRLEAEREPDPKRRQKAGGKRNLAEVAAFWVDWDPDDTYIDDDDALGHREDFLIRLEQCPTGPPSSLVWSGSGFHGYWLFEEPEDLSTPEAVARFERVLKGMCAHFGTDRATTDASRILRIPATVNWPDAAKRAKGRTVEPCVLYQPDNGRRY